jgi:ribonuclease-3
VLADFVEALIAATYLDAGPASARAVCARLVEPRLELLSTQRARLDPKTELQQRVQALGGSAPTYMVIDSGGPPHDRWFAVRVRLGEMWGAEGRGRSKRLAEREAARLTLAEERFRVAPSPGDGGEQPRAEDQAPASQRQPESELDGSGDVTH